MQEPDVYDNFRIAVMLGLGDLCLVEYALKKELACCKAAADSGESHATLRCKWYEGILAAVGRARQSGDQEYHAAWDSYCHAWNGSEDD